VSLEGVLHVRWLRFVVLATVAGMAAVWVAPAASIGAASSRQTCSPGAHTLAVHFDPPHATLLVDGEVVGEGEIKRTLWSRLSLTNAGLTVGWATDFSAADTDYRGRFEFTGSIDRVEIDVSGDPFVDAEAEARDVIAAQ